MALNYDPLGVFSLLSALIILFHYSEIKFGIFDGGKEAVEGLKSSWWFDISPEGFGAVAMLANFVVALVVNLFTKEPPQYVQDIVEDIRIPSAPPNPKGEQMH